MINGTMAEVGACRLGPSMSTQGISPALGRAVDPS